MSISKSAGAKQSLSVNFTHFYQALFPHILSKNCKMEVNFGQANHPYFSLQPGFKLIDHVPPDFLIPAARCPASQKDCEIIMMVGLPGVGKRSVF